ncbi:MAG TPA: VOC family protein [Bryobacteraceae bacterium]|nr:VOC family protein [Bryobacteraceae bacterium]
MRDKRRLHHVGYVVSSIADTVEAFQSAMGLSWDCRVIEDPLQMVRVTFLQTDFPDQPLIELVEPHGRRSPVRDFAASGGGIHHVCFEVADLAAQLTENEHAGDVLVRVPMRAAAFDGRRIAWVRTRAGALIEYLESSPQRSYSG